jgi:hypothetical protein
MNEAQFTHSKSHPTLPQGLKALLNRMKYSRTERLMPKTLKGHGGETLNLSAALSTRDIWQV